MEKMRLGKTELSVGRSGFGALPIQRISMDMSAKILRKAYENGFDFFDTARGYSDSEEKIGNALSDVRKKIIIATKSPSNTKQGVLNDLEISLGKLKTGYIDILQLHNPENFPDHSDPDGPYAGLVEARKKGLVRYIGITSHRLAVALEAAKSGLYDTIQFPLSSLSSQEDLTIIDSCKKHDIGLIAMKALSGGLITNAATTFAFLRQYDNVLPIWGIQRESELDQFIAFEKILRRSINHYGMRYKRTVLNWQAVSVVVADIVFHARGKFRSTGQQGCRFF